MSESITKELREYAADNDYASKNTVCWFADRIDARFTAELTAKQDEIDGLKADNEALRAKVDEWEKLANKQTDTILKSEHRCQAMQARIDASESYNSALRTECTDLRDKLNTRTIERDGLQSFLDASIPMPPDADGVPWTGREDEFIADTGERCRLLGVMHSVECGDFLEVDDGSGRYFIADACHHVAPEPHDSQERIDADARKGVCEYFRTEAWRTSKPTR